MRDASTDLAINISVLGEGLYAKIEPSEVYSNVGFVQSVPNAMYMHLVRKPSGSTGTRKIGNPSSTCTRKIEKPKQLSVCCSRDTSRLRGLGLGLGLWMKFRSFSAPTMLRKVPRGRRKGFCVLASNVQSIKSHS